MVLSLFVLIGWSALVSKFYHVENKGVTENIAENIPDTSISSVVSPPVVTQPIKANPLALTTISTENIDLTFNTDSATITQATFNQYQDHVLLLGDGFLIASVPNGFKQIGSLDNNKIEFRSRNERFEIIKTFKVDSGKYVLDFEVSIKNVAGISLQERLALTVGDLDFSGDQSEAQFKSASFFASERAVYPNVRKDIALDDVRFASLRDRYFCAIVETKEDGVIGMIKKIDNNRSRVGLEVKEIMFAPGEVKNYSFRIYLGPQDLQVINRVNPQWTVVMHYGVLNVIAHLLIQILHWLYSLVHNWGLAIILFSFIIYVIMLPLSIQQMKSMKSMQLLQPKVEEVRKLYKDNPQKQNKEIMELYKEHKINPLGGCLPMVLQIPVFFALYQVMMRSVALKGANFLWIKDLSLPDRLFVFKGNFNIPFLGNEVNILPILMAIGMFVQQKTSMAASAASKEAAQQQKIMLIMFPLIFGVIFYRMPSGLVMYWFVNSTLTLINQIRIARAK